MDTSDTAVEVALILLRNEDGDVLLQHRTADAPADPELWTPPGGQIEPGEAPVAAAHRELFEETGLKVDSLAPFDVLVRPSSRGNLVRFHVFSGTTDAVQADVVLGEGQAMVFTPPREVFERDLTIAARELMTAFLNG